MGFMVTDVPVETSLYFLFGGSSLTVLVVFCSVEMV